MHNFSLVLEISLVYSAFHTAVRPFGDLHAENGVPMFACQTSKLRPPPVNVAALMR